MGLQVSFNYNAGIAFITVQGRVAFFESIKNEDEFRKSYSFLSIYQLKTNFSVEGIAPFNVKDGVFYSGSRIEPP